MYGKLVLHQRIAARYLGTLATAPTTTMYVTLGMETPAATVT